jgi:hypothetical protein
MQLTAVNARLFAGAAHLTPEFEHAWCAGAQAWIEPSSVQALPASGSPFMGMVSATFFDAVMQGVTISMNGPPGSHPPSNLLTTLIRQEPF